MSALLINILSTDQPIQTARLKQLAIATEIRDTRYEYEILDTSTSTNTQERRNHLDLACHEAVGGGHFEQRMPLHDEKSVSSNKRAHALGRQAYDKQRVDDACNGNELGSHIRRRRAEALLAPGK